MGVGRDEITPRSLRTPSGLTFSRKPEPKNEKIRSVREDVGAKRDFTLQTIKRFVACSYKLRRWKIEKLDAADGEDGVTQHAPKSDSSIQFTFLL